MIEMRNSDLCLFLLTERERERERETERETTPTDRPNANVVSAVPLIKAIFRPIWRRRDMLEQGGLRKSRNLQGLVVFDNNLIEMSEFEIKLAS